MSLEARIFEENDEFSFDILQMDDILVVGEDTLPELLFTSKGYAREQTAERNATKWIDDYNKAGEPKRRRLRGDDTTTQCNATTRPVPPVRRRISK